MTRKRGGCQAIVGGGNEEELEQIAGGGFLAKEKAEQYCKYCKRKKMKRA
jgi:hypothetical protein